MNQDDSANRDGRSGKLIQSGKINQFRKLSELDCSNLVGVLTDIDDTLTTNGKLFADAYQAMWRLSEAGLHVIPITGRSAGWAHMVLKTWPVTAVVAESGGLYMAKTGRSEGGSNGIQLHLHASTAQVQADRLALQACGEQIIAQIPGLAPASDNPYRQVDYALDYCEEVKRVAAHNVAQAIALFEAHGFSARASSVHINAWRGDFDKAPMTLRLLNDHFDDALGSNHPDRWIFVGDAPNDASMFTGFARSVGVANLLGSLEQLTAKPAYLTARASGAGFIELAEHILATR
jgi:HAD superfamily hydrolase (TIGR01484 family)